MVKVIDIDIVSGTQGVEERRGLAAENSDHPLCIEQVEMASQNSGQELSR